MRLPVTIDAQHVYHDADGRPVPGVTDILRAVLGDQWAESALGLTDRDLRLMERLARAQARSAEARARGEAP
jgi:hypothetical protein